LLGMVLAAGAGRRLRPYTDTLPKALVPVDGDTTIMDISLRNLAAAGLTDVTIVVGYCAEAVEQRQADLERRYGVRITLVHNDKAEEWNNAYSLWLARDRFAGGALLVNGDTVHPVEVERRLLQAANAELLLAVDREKDLGEEEMTVLLDGDGRVRRINKAIEPARAEGEYIGLALIAPGAARPLADALEATWRRDPSLYYEDGFQELVDRGGDVHTAAIGAVEWIEVDDERDLARAREIACRS
jgi:choline kinase